MEKHVAKKRMSAKKKKKTENEVLMAMHLQAMEEANALPVNEPPMMPGPPPGPTPKPDK